MLARHLHVSLGFVVKKIREGQIRDQRGIYGHCNSGEHYVISEEEVQRIERQLPLPPLICGPFSREEGMTYQEWKYSEREARAWDDRIWRGNDGKETSVHDTSSSTDLGSKARSSGA